MLTRRKLNYLDETYVKVTLSTTNSTRTGLGLNPSLYGKRTWLQEPWDCPRTYNENETEKLFVFLSISDHLT
jgi:hypothetical protein